MPEEISPLKNRMKPFVKTALVIAVGLVALSLLGLFGAQQLNAPLDSIPDDGALFRIWDGEHLEAISRRLAEEGLVRSPLFLKLLSYAKGTQGDFQAGTYRVDQGMTSLSIHNLLVSGQEVLIRVTIPEGWNVTQVGLRLEERGITSAEEFYAAATDPLLLAAEGVYGQSVEGYLFPDTYLFPQSYPPQQVASVMIERFRREVAAIYPETAELDPKALHEIVVLASIIEREHRAPDEAVIMASVFYNRLEVDMKLQSCATVAYVMTEEFGLDFPEVLTFDDLELPSDYNTYRSVGLPPGPIASPGSVSLAAAFNPAHTDFLYFVLKDPDAGRHEFTKSFDEHLTAKNLYLKKS